MLTLNKILIRLRVLLVQIKTGNNSYKLKNEIRQILYLFLSALQNHRKTLQQFNQIIIMGAHIDGNKFTMI